MSSSPRSLTAPLAQVCIVDLFRLGNGGARRERVRSQHTEMSPVDIAGAKSRPSWACFARPDLEGRPDEVTGTDFEGHGSRSSRVGANRRLWGLGTSWLGGRPTDVNRVGSYAKEILSMHV